MKKIRTLYFTAPIVLAIFAAGACTEDRNDGFRTAPTLIAEDDGGPDAADCSFQCSLDGRSVIETCTGKVVETCSEDLACGEARCQPPCAAAAADKRSDGCDFYFQTARYTKKFAQSCHAVFVVNTSIKPVDLSLELEGKKLDISKSVYRTNPGDAELIPHSGSLPPGESAIVFISDLDPSKPKPIVDTIAPCPKGVVPASYADPLPDGTGFGSAFRLTSTMPVAVTSMYPFGGAKSYIPSATLLLPVATWGKEHLVINGWEAGKSGFPGAQIIASEDETDVTILPKVDIQDGDGVVGTLAGKSATYRLGKGQILQLLQSEELSGSIVVSTKPTSIFGGNSCADIPITGGTCDTLNQQIPAFDQWGSEYVGVGYRPRLGNEHELIAYRIVAARDGTVLDYDPEPPPGAPLTMSAGEVAMFTQGTGDAFVVRTQDADHPIYLAAYMSGWAQSLTGTSGDRAVSYGGRGDPEFVNVVPAGQYQSSYSFYADPSYTETSLVIVRAKAGNEEFKDVWLDCAGGNLTNFQPIGTRGEYEFVRVDLERNGGPGERFGNNVCRTGLQRMHSDGPFTATLWGWAYAASYAYPSGMAQRKLVKTPLAPVQ